MLDIRAVLWLENYLQVRRSIHTSTSAKSCSHHLDLGLFPLTVHGEKAQV